MSAVIDAANVARGRLSATPVATTGEEGEVGSVPVGKLIV
jgi:hypothetical protein